MREEIHPGVHIKRFLHQYDIANNGWIPAHIYTITVAIATDIASLIVEQVTVQYRDHKDFERCVAVDITDNRKLGFSCPPRLLTEDDSLVLEVNFLVRNVDNALFSGQGAAAAARTVRSTVTARWQGGGNSRGLYFTFYPPPPKRYYFQKGGGGKYDVRRKI